MLGDLCRSGKNAVGDIVTERMEKILYTKAIKKIRRDLI